MSDYKAVYDKLTAELERRTSADKRVQSVLKKIESGKAALSDTFALAADKGRLLGAVFRENLADLDPQTTEKVYDMLMRDMQRDITDKMAAVQRAADEKHGISLGAPQPTYPAERIAKIAASLHDPTVPPETLARRAQSATETVTMAFHDDYVRDNAEFRSDAGFPCFIDRIADGGCCKWCAAMAGHYEFGEEPPDMWCRHDNCRCEIVYANGYKVQSLRGTKKSWDIKTDHSYEEYRAKQPGKKTAESAEKYEPETLTREQAAQAEAEGLAKYANTLDFSFESGIIKAVSVDDIYEVDKNGIISDDCKKTIAETLDKYQKAGNNFSFEDVRLVDIPQHKNGSFDVLRTNTVDDFGYPKNILEINQSVFANVSKEDIDNLFLASANTVCESLEDAVIHEIGHAKTVGERTFANYERINEELSSIHFKGISALAESDGLECIAECEVLLSRGEKLDSELMDFYTKYTTGGG